MYSVKLTKQAKKQLDKLGTVYLTKTLKAIDELEIDPFLGNKMKGELKGLYRVKVPPIRIIYKPDIKRKNIIIIVIGHRQGIYG